MALRASGGDDRVVRAVLGVVTAAVSALGLAACSASGAARTPPTTTAAVQVSPTGVKVPVIADSDAARRRAARRAARQLMSEVRFPATAHLAASEPSGDGGGLKTAEQGQADPDQVGLHAFFVDPGTPDSVLSFTKRYPPPHSRVFETGRGSGPGVPTTRYVTFLATYEGVLDQGYGIVEVVALRGGGTGIRVDAQVTWNPPRPADSTVPAGAHVLTVTLSKGLNPGEHGHAPITTAKESVIAAVRQRVNSLLVQPPGAVTGCPMENGQSLTVTFRAYTNGTPMAVVTADVTGCEFVSVRRGSHKSTATLRGYGFAPFVEREVEISPVVGT